MLSTKERVSSARVWRKRYGAGMRQVGIIAAAGLYAIENNIPRLVEDHKKARLIAEACHAAVPSTIDPASVETNIVALNIAGASVSASEFALLAKEKGVLVSALGPTFVRLVTHMDIDDETAAKSAAILAELLNSVFVAK